MFTQAKFRGGYNFKFVSAILFAVTFLVGGFFIFNTANAAPVITVNTAKITGPNQITIVFNSTLNLTAAPVTAYATTNNGVAALTLSSGGGLRDIVSLDGFVSGTGKTAVYTFSGAAAPSGTTGSLFATTNPTAITDGTDIFDATTSPIPLTDGQAPASNHVYTQADFTAFDGVDIGTNSLTASQNITATYTGNNTIKLTGYAPIVIPSFGKTWTTYNYVTVGIKLPADFAGTTSVYQTGIMRYDVNPTGAYKMGTIGDGTTPLATAGAALHYLDYSFAANSTNTKKDGLVKLEVIWNSDSTPEYFTIDINGLQTGPVFVDTIKNGTFDSGEKSFNTIQAAIDDENTISGDTIIVGAGTYDLTSRIDVTKAVSIIGDVTTPSNVVINAPGAGGTQHGQNSVFMITSNDVTVKGFRIQGALHTGAAQNAGIYVDDPRFVANPGLSHITISNNEITDNGYGIFVHNIKDSTISNNKVYSNKSTATAGKEYDAGVGIVIYGRAEDSSHTYNLTIDNNQVYSNETEGIRVDVSSDVEASSWVNDLAITISNNIIHNNGRTIGSEDKYIGIKSAGMSKGVTISGNEIYGHAMSAVPSASNQSAGIWIAPSNDWQIENNNIHDNTNGIIFVYSYPEAGSHTILGNNIHNNVRGISTNNGLIAVANNKNSIYFNDSTAFSSVPFLPYNVYNSGSDTFDATQNWWGIASGPATGTIIGSVDFDPYYIDESMSTTNVDAANTAATLATAKTTAHSALTTALGTYTSTKYTAGNWTTLNGFKTTGDTAINAATDLAGVSTAQSTATTGMSGVAVINRSHSSSSRSATPAIPATPAVPGISPAIPATPAVPAGKVLGAEAYNFTLLIKNNSKGNEVIELQKYLIANGYLTGIADGSFGPNTLEGVKKFQNANSLVADGIVGPAAREILNKALVTPATPAIPADGNGTPATPAVPATYNFGTTNLKNGSHGDAVQELQRFLNNILGLELVVDGKLGPKTIAVIKQWQGDNGLDADGIIGVKTKALMNSQVK